jgi:hypothetical protein
VRAFRLCVDFLGQCPRRRGMCRSHRRFAQAHHLRPWDCLVRSGHTLASDRAARAVRQQLFIVRMCPLESPAQRLQGTSLGPHRAGQGRSEFPSPRPPSKWILLLHLSNLSLESSRPAQQVYIAQCEGQDEGAVMLGLGHTLIRGDGLRRPPAPERPNANLVDYRVPCALDLPAHLFCVFVENGNGAGPFGAQGARRAQSARHTRSEVSGRSRKRSR